MNLAYTRLCSDQNEMDRTRRKTNKIFLQLGKSRYAKKNSFDEITRNPTIINKDIESFCTNMYTSKIDETLMSQQNIPFEDFIEIKQERTRTLRSRLDLQRA